MIYYVIYCSCFQSATVFVFEEIYGNVIKFPSNESPETLLEQNIPSPTSSCLQLQRSTQVGHNLSQLSEKGFQLICQAFNKSKVIMNWTIQ